MIAGAEVTFRARPKTLSDRKTLMPLKIPARRAASTLTRNARSPVPAEPAHLGHGDPTSVGGLDAPRHLYCRHARAKMGIPEDLVVRVWNYAHVLSDEDVSYERSRQRIFQRFPSRG